MEIIKLGRMNTDNYLPNEGPVNGSLIEYDCKTSAVKRIKTYDENGQVIKEIDFGHNHGAGDPHVHDFYKKGTLSPTKRRGKARPITDNETKDMQGFFNNNALNKSMESYLGLHDFLDFHDDELLSVYYKKNDSIVLRTDNHVVEFIGIVDVELTNLSIQNVLFDIEMNITEEMINKKKNSVVIKDSANKDIIVLLNSSIGMNGCIICKKLKIKSKV